MISVAWYVGGIVVMAIVAAIIAGIVVLRAQDKAALAQFNKCEACEHHNKCFVTITVPVKEGVEDEQIFI